MNDTAKIGEDWQEEIIFMNKIWFKLIALRKGIRFTFLVLVALRFPSKQAFRFLYWLINKVTMKFEKFLLLKLKYNFWVSCKYGNMNIQQDFRQ